MCTYIMYTIWMLNMCLLFFFILSRYIPRFSLECIWYTDIWSYTCNLHETHISWFCNTAWVMSKHITPLARWCFIGVTLRLPNGSRVTWCEGHQRSCYVPPLDRQISWDVQSVGWAYIDKPRHMSRKYVYFEHFLTYMILYMCILVVCFSVDA